MHRPPTTRRGRTTALTVRYKTDLVFVSFRYCGSLDGVLESHVTDISSAERKRLFHQFLSLSVSSGKFQVSRPLLCSG